MVSIRLSPNIEDRLSILAARTQRSKSFYIKEAITRYLDDMEDYFITIDRISIPNRKLHSNKDVQDMLDEL